MKITPARLGLLREAREALSEIGSTIGAYLFAGDINPICENDFKHIMKLCEENYAALNFVAKGVSTAGIEAIHEEVVKILIGILKGTRETVGPKLSKAAWDILKITIDHPPVCPYPPIVPDPEKR